MLLSFTRLEWVIWMNCSTGITIIICLLVQDRNHYCISNITITHLTKKTSSVRVNRLNCSAVLLTTDYYNCYFAFMSPNYIIKFTGWNNIIIISDLVLHRYGMTESHCRISDTGFGTHLTVSTRSFTLQTSQQEILQLLTSARLYSLNNYTLYI